MVNKTFNLTGLAAAAAIATSALSITGPMPAQAQNATGPVDSSVSRSVPSMAAAVRADGSLDVAWRRGNGQTIVSNYAGADYQQATHTAVNGAMELFGGYTRDDAGNGYVLSLKEESISLRDDNGAIRDPSSRRPNVAQVLRVPDGGDACLLVDLNQQSIYGNWGIYNPGLNHTSRLAYGNGTVAAAFGHNIPGSDARMHNTGTLIGVNTNGLSTYSGGAGNHSLDDHLWFDGANFVKVQDGDQGLLMSRLTRQNGNWSWSQDKLVYRRQAADPGNDTLDLDEYVRFGMVANGSGDEYLLLTSGAPGLGYAGSYDQEWAHWDVTGASLYLTKVPKSGFESLPTFSWPANAVGQGVTTTAIATPPQGSTSNYVRSRMVQLANDRYVIVFEQWTSGKTYEQTMAMVIDGSGQVVTQPQVLTGNPRIQRATDAFVVNGRIGWLAGDNANQRITLHTLDASLSLSSHQLGTSGAPTTSSSVISACQSVTTGPTPTDPTGLNANVCKPQGTAGGWTNIKKVQFKDALGNVLLLNEQDNTSAAYEDFTADAALALTAKPGDVLTTLIESSHDATRPTKIWVDIDNDGAFNETNERLLNANIGNAEGSVSIPADLAVGTYRLRIRKGWDHQNACHYDKWTQVEDYTLQVVDQVTTAPTPNPSPAPAEFKAALQGVQSGKCVDVPAQSTADDVELIQWSCHSGPNQKLTFKPVTGMADVYTLVFDHSGKCMNAPDNTNGTELVQQSCNGSASQQFKMHSVGNDIYRLTAASSGKSLDVEGFSLVDLGRIQQWDYVGGENQKWRVLRDL